MSTLCRWAPILAHAKSGEPPAIGGYRSKSDGMDDIVAAFAAVYAGQTGWDYHPSSRQPGKSGFERRRNLGSNVQCPPNEFPRISSQ